LLIVANAKLRAVGQQVLMSRLNFLAFEQVGSAMLQSGLGGFARLFVQITLP
jgi:hypothetical protein